MPVRDVELLGKRERALGTKTFTFSRPRDLEYRPGQFFFLTLPPVRAGAEPPVHHFSFSSSPTEPHIEFTTRMTGSEYKDRIDSLESGTAVTVDAPYGSFVLHPGMAKVCYVCGGIGITPVRSTVRWAVDTDAAVDIVVLYANRDLANAAFHDEFASIASPRVRVRDILSHPTDDWKGPTGHIDGAFVRAQVPDHAERHFFVSGPRSMVDALAEVLKRDVDVPEERVTMENFAGYP